MPLPSCLAAPTPAEAAPPPLPTSIPLPSHRAASGGLRSCPPRPTCTMSCTMAFASWWRRPRSSLAVAPWCTPECRACMTCAWSGWLQVLRRAGNFERAIALYNSALNIGTFNDEGYKAVLVNLGALRCQLFFGKGDRHRCKRMSGARRQASASMPWAERIRLPSTLRWLLSDPASVEIWRARRRPSRTWG